VARTGEQNGRLTIFGRYRRRGNCLENAAQILGWIAASFTLSAFFMKTMVPLRSLAIASNIAFASYGLLVGAWNILALHAILLPFNAMRLVEMRRLTDSVTAASKGDLNADWLKPFMAKRLVKAGEILFRKGDRSDAMYYTVRGRFRLPEIPREVGPGEIIGELGLIAPENKRTATFECVQDGELLIIGYSQVKQLYFQNPSFGFYFLHLISRRLLQEIARLEEKRARPT
jgi:hypothetical protein